MQMRSTKEHEKNTNIYSINSWNAFVIFRVLSWIIVFVCGTAIAQKAPTKPVTKPPVEKPKIAVKIKPVAPDERDLLFSGGKVLQISIELTNESLESLRRDGRKYVSATLKEGVKIYGKVAVHLRGAAGSTRSIDDKPGLTLNMDKFVDGQKFHGMDKWYLTNSVQDPTYANELVCGEMFREAGVPAARFAHAIVEINGRKRGLYCIKEGYDSVFFKRYFGNGNGNFYDGGFLRDIDQPLELNAGKNDVPEQTDLKALLKAANENDPAERFKKMEILLDMERFLSYLAMTTITDDWDGYARNRNNYRIYHDPKRNKIVFIPSGMDQMFRNPSSSVMPGYGGLVARRLIETPEGKRRYLARLRQVIQTVSKPEVRIKRLEVLEAQLKPSLTSVDQGAGNDYPNRINEFKRAIRERAKSLVEQLKSQPTN